MELPGHCYITPTGNGSLLLHHLGPAGSYRPESVVVVPYARPAVQPIAAEFYPILKTEVTDCPSPPDIPEMTLRALTSEKDYLAMVKKLKQHIARGDIYEINYCTKFTGEASPDLPAVFTRLMALTHAPYTFMLKTGDRYMLCASPELFLRKTGSRLVTRPIKGTMRRGSSAAEDEALREQLRNSHKDRTENVMAVDVARNDLSRLATRGSVVVEELFGVETFSTVHQLVSTVSCTLKDVYSGNDQRGFQAVMDATFPMASMTGAPKVRAMELISEVENFSRDRYSGCTGMIDAEGNFTLSVNIRCIFYDAAQRTVSICAGGAITALSDAQEEYRECLLKAAAMMRAVNGRLAG